MEGIEKADSICWDAHKMMGVPLVCSAFLVKDASILSQMYKFTETAHYLFKEESRDSDLGRLSLQCGRRNDGLKLFLAWREKGDAGWARMVESYMNLADYLETLVKSSDKLELVCNREWTNVCIRYISSDQDLNELNLQIREQLTINGNYMVSRSVVDEKIILRVVIANHTVTKETIDGLVSEITRIGDEITKGIPQKK